MTIAEDAVSPKVTRNSQLEVEEGMLGIITELTLSLETLPKELWGIVFFFERQSHPCLYIF